MKLDYFIRFGGTKRGKRKSDWAEAVDGAMGSRWGLGRGDAWDGGAIQISEQVAAEGRAEMTRDCSRGGIFAWFVCFENNGLNINGLKFLPCMTNILEIFSTFF